MPAAELRFEAIYFGVLAVMGAAVYLVRFGADAAGLAVWVAAAAAAGGLLHLVSVRRRLARAVADPGTVGEDGVRVRSETAQRMLPLLLITALLAMAGERTAAAVGAGCLAGWAVAALLGFLAARSAVT